MNEEYLLGPMGGPQREVFCSPGDVSATAISQCARHLIGPRIAPGLFDDEGEAIDKIFDPARSVRALVTGAQQKMRSPFDCIKIVGQCV